MPSIKRTRNRRTRCEGVTLQRPLSYFQATATERARQLRKDMTDSERKLWREFGERQLARHRFRRQHPLGPYVVDFVCLPRRFVVEIDGGQRSSPSSKHDGARHGSKPKALACCGSGTRKCSTISTALSKRFARIGATAGGGAITAPGPATPSWPRRIRSASANSSQAQRAPRGGGGGSSGGADVGRRSVRPAPGSAILLLFRSSPRCARCRPLVRRSSR